MEDLSKAFNRINHNIMITILSDMGVPGWLLRIIMGFLSDRERVLRYKGLKSNRKRLPRLGLFLFLILINVAGVGILQTHTGEHITTKLNKRKPIILFNTGRAYDFMPQLSIQEGPCWVLCCRAT